MLKQRSISAIGIVLVAAIPALVGGPLFAVVVLALAVLALHELVQAFHTTGAHLFWRLGLAGCVALVGAVALRLPLEAVAAILTAIALVTLAAGLFRQDLAGVAVDWALTVASVLYVAVPLAHFVALRELHGSADRAWVRQLTQTAGAGNTAAGLAWFGLALSVTWLTDTAAYLVGRSFGTTKLIPRISPGKTRVGAVAGVVAGALTGIAASALFGVPIPWYAGALAGLVLAVVGQIGDLCESLIKRSIGIKDMGTLIPGHGGILDRIDALLLTIPTAYYLARLLQEVRWP